MGGPSSNTKNIMKIMIRIANIPITMNMGFFMKKGPPLMPIILTLLSCLLTGGGYDFGSKVGIGSVSTDGDDVKVVDVALGENVEVGGVSAGVSVITSSPKILFKGGGISGNKSNGVSQ